MSTYELPRRIPHDPEEKLAILETVLQHNSIRLSTLAETLSLDGDTSDVLLELRNADLVSACPLDGEDDSIVTSLPRLRSQERTKIHRLIYN